MKSTSRGLSVLEMMLTLIIISIVFCGTVRFYQLRNKILVSSSASEIARFIRTNHALAFLANNQTRIKVDRSSSVINVVSGPAISSPNIGFTTIRLKSPLRIAAANFGDLNAQLIQISLRSTGSATPGSLRLDTGENTPGCSLIVSLRGSVQTICD
jgi:hypothetical protein